MKNRLKVFEEYILPHYDSVYLYINKMIKDKEYAEDIVQNAVMKAWIHLHTLKSLDKAKTWLFSIAKNEMYMLLRRNKYCVEWDFTDETMLSIVELKMLEEDVLDLTLREEAAVLIRKAVKYLPEKYKTLIEMRFFWDYSEKEIAEIMGMNYSTVRVYIKRGLADLLYYYKKIVNEGEESLGPPEEE